MLLITDQSSPDALSEAEAAFSHWRQTRTSLLTPELLKRQALSLLSHYRISHVCKRLRVNHQTLKRWRQQYQPESNAVPFIELPPQSTKQPPSLSPSSPAMCLTLSRHLSDGNTLSVQGELSQPQWQWALQLLQQQESSV